MVVLLAVLSAAFLVFGVLVLTGRLDLIVIGALDDGFERQITAGQRYTMASVFVFVGALLGLTAYGFSMGEPMWFLRQIFALAT